LLDDISHASDGYFCGLCNFDAVVLSFLYSTASLYSVFCKEIFRSITSLNKLLLFINCLTYWYKIIVIEEYVALCVLRMMILSQDTRREFFFYVDYAANRILSAAGEIHREYKAQLQMAEEEMRRQRQAEQIASEALIQKIQVEDQLLLAAQLAQDQLLAKTLAKQQQKEATKCYNECLGTPDCVFNESKFNYANVRVNNTETPQIETVCLEGRHMGLPESVRDNSKTRQMNALLSKMGMYSNVCGSKEANASSMHKNPANPYCCQKQTPIYNAIAKKHQTISKFTQPCTSNYSMDPGCSTSRAYATETKEELRVPSDVVNSKKKSLGIEVCTTLADDDERIGSAESSGSHDSINQEIHHFKPIKTVPRTKLQISSGMYRK